MKVLVLLSLAAFCFAQSTYSDKHVTVWSNGVISIHGDAGKEIYIYKNIVNPNKVNVVLKSAYGPAKKIVVDEANNIHDVNFNTLDAQYFSIFQNLGNAYTQHDVLVNLFHQHEGLVNAVQYQELLETIHHLVQQQILHQTIENVLQNYFSQQHQQWVADYMTYVPIKEQHGVGSYSPQSNQILTPLQSLQSLIQQHQYGQEHQNGQELYQHNYPEHQTVYQYGQHQGSVGGSQSWSHQLQYQTPSVHQQAYVQGSYHQNPQGIYQKQSWVPQQWWNGQQWWNTQNMWNPQQYAASQQYTPYHQYQKQSWVPQQWWNGQQWWNTQNMWNPNQVSASQQYTPYQQVGNSQQYSASQQYSPYQHIGSHGVLPLVY